MPDELTHPSVKASEARGSAPWTDGPWKAELPSKVWQVNSVRASVALVIEQRAGDDRQTEANARLISAAPDLYAALAMAQEFICSHPPSYDALSIVKGHQITDALAKARGESAMRSRVEHQP